MSIDCTQSELRDALSRDAAFLKRLRKAEARAEIKHMKTIRKAIEDPKNWRASVWWFERRSPERFARKAATITARDMNEVVDQLVEFIRTEVASESDRQRLIARLTNIERAIPSELSLEAIVAGDEAESDDPRRDAEVAELRLIEPESTSDDANREEGIEVG